MRATTGQVVFFVTAGALTADSYAWFMHGAPAWSMLRDILAAAPAYLALELVDRICGWRK